MPRPSRPWFRVYVEMFPDRKIRRLTPAQRWIWVALMGAARESPRSPELYVADDLPMTLREIADYADVRERDVTAALVVMEKLGMVAIHDDVVSLPNFAHRQFDSDNVTARTRAHRERSKEQPDEHQKNVPKNVRRNAPETETETETETEKNLRTSEGSPTVPAGFVPRVVRAYAEASRDAGQPAPEESQARVERSARSLLGQGFPLDDVVEAARNAAAAGWTDLATQLQRDAARARPTNGANGTRPSTTETRAHAALALADELDRKALG